MKKISSTISSMVVSGPVDPEGGIPILFVIEEPGQKTIIEQGHRYPRPTEESGFLQQVRKKFLSGE